MNRGLPLFGYYLLPTFGTPYVLILSLNSANIAGGTKRAISTGAIFIGYNAGNIAGSYLVFTPELSVHYRSTWIAVIVSMVFTSCSAVYLRWYMVRENAKRDAAQTVSIEMSSGVENDKEKVVEGNESSIPEQSPFSDLTDKEQTSFRYSL